MKKLDIEGNRGLLKYKVMNVPIFLNKEFLLWLKTIVSSLFERKQLSTVHDRKCTCKKMFPNLRREITIFFENQIGVAL